MNPTQTTITTYNNKAQAYEARFMAMDLYNDTYDSFIKKINNKTAHVLDIACGPGNVSRYLLSKEPGYQIDGVDLAPNMIELARVNNPGARFKVMDCRQLNSLPEKYNGIICAFGMPYLSKVECCKLIHDASLLLKPNGTFYFSTMEGDCDKSGFETTSFSDDEQVYIYYHQATYLKKCLTLAGFSNIQLNRKKYPEPDGSFLTDMIFISTKE